MAEAPELEILVPLHAPPAAFAASLSSLREQAAAHGAKLIFVDDGIDSATRSLIEDGSGELIEGSKRGAAAALQLGFEHGQAKWILQIDQDVVLEDAFIEAILAVIDDDNVAAVQGWYLAPEDAGLWSDWAAWDLDERWRQDSATVAVDHVCSGVTLYRRSALDAVGGFPRDFGYGYDSELSARLIDAGFSLLRCRDSRAQHHFPETAAASFRQHFGQGYGRLEMVMARPERSRGDQVSSPTMMLHAAASALMPVALIGSLFGSAFLPELGLLAGAIGLVFPLALVGANTFDGFREVLRTCEPKRFGLFVFRCWRDLAWGWACWRFAIDRLFGRTGPQRSMPRRN